MECRGQVVRVKAPWIKHYYNADGKFYIIPNLDTVVLGGTLNHNSWDTTISQEVRCAHVLPVRTCSMRHFALYYVRYSKIRNLAS